MLTRRSLMILSGAALPLPSLAQAAEFPSGPITIIVSFPAGGSIDVVVRAMAGPLQRQLGKAIVIENRPGAGGVLATGDVVKAAPTG
jgi:tripartite-type tricarboxylate transporter receptor subunit TctC